MQFSLITLFAAITGAAMASPMSLHNIRSCDATKCALALGPVGATCLASGVDPLNAIGDIGCVSNIVANIVNPPTVCGGCNINAGTLKSAENAVGDAFGSATSAIGNVF